MAAVQRRVSTVRRVSQTVGRGKRRQQTQKAQTTAGEGAQVWGTQHPPRPGPDRRRWRGVRVALRALGRPSPQPKTGTVRFMVAADPGDEAEVLKKFLQISFSSKVFSKVSGKSVPSCCVVPSRE